MTDPAVKQECCAACRFFKPRKFMSPTTVPVSGRCRRNPPSDGGFPEVAHDDWCGRFERKETDDNLTE